MEQAYQFAQGPLFRFCFALMVLGLVRKMVLYGYGRALAMRVTRDTAIAGGPVLRESLRWFFPLGKLSRGGGVLAVISMVFHAGLLAVPLFLDDHLLLLRKATGIYWSSLPACAADVLSVCSVIAAVFLLAVRIVRHAFRTISGVQDYGFLILIITIILTGLLASRPFNPFSYSGTMFVHAMAGNALMAFLPFSKMVHGVVFPAVRYFSQVGWKLSPGSLGRRTGQSGERDVDEDRSQKHKLTK